MMQGGPLMHAVAAKAVNLKECLQPEYQTYARQVIANAQALTEGLAAEALRPVAGGWTPTWRCSTCRRPA